MRKLILPFTLVAAAALMLSTTACKKADFDMSWYVLEGSGFYHSQDDTSSIKLTGIVEFEIPRVATEPMYAWIVDWRYLVLEGNHVVLEIDNLNFYSVLGDITFGTSDRQSDFLWVVIETQVPKVGDIYNGANPDTVILTLWIVDNNGNTYALETDAPFAFTRD